MKKFRETVIESSSNKILKDRVRILYFSDMHCKDGFDFSKLTLIKDYVAAISPKPNVILFGGDLIDDTKTSITSLQKIKEFIESLSVGENIPVVIGTGNHDQMTKNPDASLLNRLRPGSGEKAWLEFHNTGWLEELLVIPNTYVLQSLPEHTKHFEKLGLAVGEVNLPYTHYEQDGESIESFLHYANQSEYNFKKGEHNILMVHTPNAVCEDEAQIGLKCADVIDEAFCGHNHGGISPRWFNKLSKKGLGLINPQMKLLKPYCAGMVKGIKFPVTISTGISKMNIGIVDKILKPEIIIEDIVKVKQR